LAESVTTLKRGTLTPIPGRRSAAHRTPARLRVRTPLWNFAATNAQWPSPRFESSAAITPPAASGLMETLLTVRELRKT